jgi:hypothetical protein
MKCRVAITVACALFVVPSFAFSLFGSSAADLKLLTQHEASHVRGGESCYTDKYPTCIAEAQENSRCEDLTPANGQCGHGSYRTSDVYSSTKVTPTGREENFQGPDLWCYEEHLCTYVSSNGVQFCMDGANIPPGLLKHQQFISAGDTCPAE